MHALGLVIAASLLSTQAPQPAPLSPEAATGQQTDVKFRSDDHDRMTVQVRVSDRGPFHFLIDTGSERTVISRQLANELGLAEGERTTLRSVLGSTAVATVNIPALQVTSRILAVQSAPALDADNIGADGMLGVDSLAEQRVMLDFKHGSMGISPSRTAVEPVSDGETIVVIAHRRHGRLLISNATIEGRDVVIVIDTGSQISIGNEALRRSLGRKRVLPTTIIETVMGEKAIAEVLSIHELKIEGLTMVNANIAFLHSPVFAQLDLDKRPAMLLGMNLMRGFERVSIDFATGKVRFVLPGTSMVRETRLASR